MRVPVCNTMWSDGRKKQITRYKTICEKPVNQKASFLNETLCADDFSTGGGTHSYTLRLRETTRANYEISRSKEIAKVIYGPFPIPYNARV